MDRLWSPWRLTYIMREGETRGCVFCDALTEADAGPLVLFRGPSCFVVLNLYPYNNGHVLVVPNRHIPSLATATAAELCELMELTRRAELALTEAYSPQGLNMGINLGTAGGAGVLEHLHMHVVPRWNGDTNFMTIVGTTRVLPEELPETARRLRPIFEKLDAQGKVQ
jgi:ATP adenylyltransferase